MLFKIRFEIYQRKFKIKFLNNFLAQLTPFLFYLIGGYLAITGPLDGVSLSVDAGQRIAVFGDAYSGANVLAEAFGGVVKPARGKILAGNVNLSTLPESVKGQRITYVSTDTYYFTGSLADNLL